MRVPRAPAPAVKTKKPEATKAGQMTVLGDRLFRAGNLRKASDRYDQALRLDPHSAEPRIRLAQIALVRGQFAEAAHQIREAIMVDRDWLAKAGDIESLYSEPADFAKQIEKLESHLQASPNDRDAWLVLGAEWFLSGRTRKAADVFLRLADRKPDRALEAFLDATTPADRPER
jgi:cytochrome c-type biogenesis protein CcmH/NrfG